MAAPTFETVFREVVIKRDDLENGLASALESASSTNELEKLQKQVVKISRYYAKCEDEIREKSSKLGPSSTVPAAKPEQTAKSGAPRSGKAGETVDASKSVERVKNNAPDLHEEKSTVEQPVKENTVIDFAKVRMPARLAGSKSDTQSLKEADARSLKEAKNALVYFEQLNPDTTEDSLRQGLLDLGYQPLKVEMSTWKGGKTRGTATVTLRKVEEALELVGRNDVEIDGWSVSPRILLADQLAADSNISSETGSEQTNSEVKTDGAGSRNDVVTERVEEPATQANDTQDEKVEQKKTDDEPSTKTEDQKEEKTEGLAEDQADEEGNAMTMSKKQKKAAKKAAAKQEKVVEKASTEVLAKAEAPVASAQEAVKPVDNAKKEEKVDKKEEAKNVDKAEEKKPAQNGAKKEEEKKKEKTNEPKEPGQLESILTNGFIPSTHHVMGYLLERIKWGREDVQSAE